MKGKRFVKSAGLELKGTHLQDQNTKAPKATEQSIAQGHAVQSNSEATNPVTVIILDMDMEDFNSTAYELV